MTERLRALERQINVTLSSNRSTDVTMEANNDDKSTIRLSRQNTPSRTHTGFQRLSRAMVYPFTFDQDLQKSRVYLRTASQPDHGLSGISLSSPAVQSVCWFILSGLSVSEVSNISILALPMSRDDLYNPQHFETSQDLDLGLPEDRPPSCQESPCKNLTFKLFDNALDDPCLVFITAALRRYKMMTQSWRYSLFIVYDAGCLSARNVRNIGLGEFPLRLFRQLENGGKDPSFMLQLRASGVPLFVPYFEEYSFGFANRWSTKELALVDLKSQLLLSPEDKLLNAFRLLNPAKQLDDVQSYEGALNLYGSGCGLLQQVMNGFLLYPYWTQLQTIVSTCSTDF